MLAANGGSTSLAALKGAATTGLSNPAQGEFGGGLDFLRKHYSAPLGPEETNYFIELWAEQNLRAFAAECKLTNNHALFINSHGMGLPTRQGIQHVFFPHQSLLGRNEKTPHFSAADLAAVLGSANAGRVHNILLSACDADASFDARELRRYFVNATNIVHIPRGKSGYQSMFFQVLTSHSSTIKPVYEICSKNRAGKLEYFMQNTPSTNATEFSPYIAELFKPGKFDSYRTQIAGRELLLPVQLSMDLSKTP